MVFCLYNLFTSNGNTFLGSSHENENHGIKKKMTPYTIIVLHLRQFIAVHRHQSLIPVTYS